MGQVILGKAGKRQGLESAPGMLHSDLIPAIAIVAGWKLSKQGSRLKVTNAASTSKLALPGEANGTSPPMAMIE